MASKPNRGWKELWHGLPSSALIRSALHGRVQSGVEENSSKWTEILERDHRVVHFFIVVQPFHYFTLPVRLLAWAATWLTMEISNIQCPGKWSPYFICWLCWGVINPIGSVFNINMYSLFFVNKELLSQKPKIRTSKSAMCASVIVCALLARTCSSSVVAPIVKIAPNLEAMIRLASDINLNTFLRYV